SVHRPTWPAVVNSINEYINLLRREESLETRDAITLQRKIRNITYVIQEGRIAKAKKMIRVFQSDVTRMMEIGTFPPVEASNLLLMSKQLYRRL
ncbi:MAG: hypothetical protein H6558_15455, partial [Lewinellaceae bacterium]|nr:hypothetical protein [Lewinellaceae bacterium]